MCSERIISTVALNDEDSPFAGDIPNQPNGESDFGELLLRGRGLASGELNDSLEKSPFGVVVPVFVPEASEPRGRFRASEAAFRRRFVVPRAFVEPERAEQTTATLCWLR